MKVTKSTVEKMVISKLQDMDPISVFFEDFGKHSISGSEAGKVSIEVYGKSWSVYWGAMGCPIKEFFLGTDNLYVIGKFDHAHRPEAMIDAEDTEDIKEGLTKVINEYEEEGHITEEEAVMALNSLDCVYNMDSFMHTDELDCLGSERWHLFPKVENSEYTYACRVLDYIREALKQDKKK